MEKLILFLPLLTLTATYAASFDCKNAKTNIEKLICSNAEASALDEKTAALYKEAAARDPSLIKLQKKWIDERALCTTVICVDNISIRRNNELNHFITVYDYKDRKNANSAESVEVKTNILNDIKVDDSDINAAPTQAVYIHNETTVHEDGGGGDIMGVVEIGFAFIALIVAIYSWFGYKSHCPKCKKWFVQEEQGQNFVEKWNRFKTIEQKDDHDHSYDHTIKTAEATFYKYHIRKRCKNCRYEWDEDFIEVVKT